MKIENIDLHHLRCLAVLAEELNFGRAADRLHMSQPPLTRLVADLEKALGAKLFARTTRRVALTPIGEVFAAEAHAVLARMDEALRHVIDAIGRESGLLRLNYTPNALQSVLPGLLSEFRARDHDARIDLVEITGTARAILESGRAEMTFSDERVREPGYASVLLRRDFLSLLVHEAHPIARRASVTIEEIGGAPMILHPRHEYPDYYDRVMAAFDASGAPSNVLLREPGQNCMALVVGGAGVLLTPARSDHFQTPGLRCVPLENSPMLYADIWANWKEEGASERVKTLAAIVRERIWKQPIPSS